MIQKFDQTLKYLLGFSLSLLLLLILLSLMARWLQLPLLWVEPLARHLVLLITFLGSTLAIGQARHIRIDFLDHLLKKQKKINQVRSYLIAILSLAILTWLCQASYLFWSMEKEYPSQVFLNLKNYQVTAIIPFGFALMWLRLVCNFWQGNKN